jgi:hypothetical protein
MRNSKRWIVIMVIGVLCGTIFGAEEFTKEGKIALKEEGKAPEKEQLIQAGEKVVFKVNAYIDDFMDRKIINANANLINLTDDTQRLLYVITFYDANKNIVGAYAANCTLDPKQNTSYGSAIIEGKLKDFKAVTSYRLYACSYRTVPEK